MQGGPLCENEHEDVHFVLRGFGFPTVTIMDLREYLRWLEQNRVDLLLAGAGGAERLRHDARGATFTGGKN